MAATTTLTPTLAGEESPTLIKRASTSMAKSPTTPTQTYHGCSHVKNLLQQAREKAIDGYTKLINALQEEGNISDRVVKNTGEPTASGEVTYLCLQCPNITHSRERHRKEHGFSVESANGFILCHECKDFVYDPMFEEIRCVNRKKRKYSTSSTQGDSKLLSTNATATPCAATGLRGLYNMGQTCFMSVVLQSLIHNPLIRTYYLSEGHRSSECDRDACTSCAMDDIFTDFYGQEKHEGYGAVHMLQGCWKSGGGLAGYSQQDAHEYLGFILNSLHESNAEDGEGGNDGHNDSKDCTCVIHQTFGGILKSTVTCSTCHNTTTAIDPFMDLSLDIKNAVVSLKKKKLAMINGTQTIKEVLPMDLTECLDRFTSAETLSGDMYNCRKCNASRQAMKKLSLGRLPPVMIIHLKRFSHSKANSQSSKVDTKIRFPLTIDFAPYATSGDSSSSAHTSSRSKEKSNGHGQGKSLADHQNDDEGGGEDCIEVKTPTKLHPPEPQQPIYELSSVVVHKGKIDNGHYISYSKQGGEWFRFDDSMVVQVDEKEVLNAEAYMLFYVVVEF